MAMFVGGWSEPIAIGINLHAGILELRKRRGQRLCGRVPAIGQHDHARKALALQIIEHGANGLGDLSVLADRFK